MIIGASLATVVAVWQRFRRARGEERQQMRWLVAVATVAGAGIGGILLLFPLVGVLGLDEKAASANVIFLILFVPALLAIFVGIPAAYLVAIFKHGLWDLDVVIKKALVALVLTLVIVGVGLGRDRACSDDRRCWTAIGRTWWSASSSASRSGRWRSSAAGSPNASCTGGARRRTRC